MVQVLLQAFISSPNTILQCIFLLPSSRESQWSSSCDGVVSFSKHMDKHGYFVSSPNVKQWMFLLLLSMLSSIGS